MTLFSSIIFNFRTKSPPSMSHKLWFFSIATIRSIRINGSGDTCYTNAPSISSWMANVVPFRLNWFGSAMPEQLVPLLFMAHSCAPIPIIQQTLSSKLLLPLLTALCRLASRKKPCDVGVPGFPPDASFPETVEKKQDHKPDYGLPAPDVG